VDRGLLPDSRLKTACGASSGPECRMRKTFPSGATVETSGKIAPEIEAMICEEMIRPILEAQAATAPPPPPAAVPLRRRRS
jgi:hypothetical protein